MSSNDLNKISFISIKTKQIRVVFTRDKAKGHYVGITELEVWAEWPQTNSPNVYEAEDGVITDAFIESSSTASGKSFVGGIDNKTSNVEFCGIFSPSTGNFKIRVYYANGDGKPATHTLYINNLHTITINYPVTKSGSGNFDDDTYVELTVPLLYGNNILIFEHANNFAQIDKISIIL